MLSLGASVNAVAQVLHPPHPLELEALHAPQQVIEQLPDLLGVARDQERPLDVALLQLAHANACRVIADWRCQATAGAQAAEAAQVAAAPDLEIRGLIAEARGYIALSDYTPGEQTLGVAEQLLSRLDAPVLAADVYLAYATLSYRIGKFSLSVEYADKGLQALPADLAMPMQVRLWRSKAEAQIELGELAAANDALTEAEARLPRIDDPKLEAEVLLGEARLARNQGDIETQTTIGARILRLAGTLSNAQLSGQGHEVLGLASLQSGQIESGQQSLLQALTDFRQMGLLRDQHRVLAELLLAEGSGDQRQDWIEHFIEIGRAISRHEQAVAADDFQEHLDYARQELSLQKMEVEAELQAEREQHLQDRLHAWMAQTTLFGLFTLSLLGGLMLQRRHARQLAEAVQFRQRALIQTSHELRHPLSGIVGLSDLLLSEDPDSRQQPKVASIRLAAKQLQELAQDLLDRGRLEGGHLSLRPEVVDLPELLERTRELHESNARGRGLTLKVAISEGLPRQIWIDGTRLAQVINNLLGNSLKFTERGSVELSVRRLPDTSKGGIQVQFCVSDTGPGLSPEELKQLFRPFAKLRAGARHQSGAGLGLSISHELVALMGGELKASSVEGQGTTFSFVLSLSESSPGTAPAHLASASIMASRFLAPVTAVALDDDPDVLLVHQAVLEQLGAHVRTCTTVAEARELLQRITPNLLLTDLELGGPDQNSLALCAEVDRLGGRARVVVISGHPPPDQLPAGVDEWLQKPVSMSRWAMLLAHVRTLALKPDEAISEQSRPNKSRP
ncbi:MAG: response regulator [Xanthomonadales bacterium]|nr:response regulator [Xanthomonadales bacterium]